MPTDFIGFPGPDAGKIVTDAVSDAAVAFEAEQALTKLPVYFGTPGAYARESSVTQPDLGRRLFPHVLLLVPATATFLLGRSFFEAQPYPSALATNAFIRIGFRVFFLRYELPVVAASLCPMFLALNLGLELRALTDGALSSVIARWFVSRHKTLHGHYEARRHSGMCGPHRHLLDGMTGGWLPRSSHKRETCSGKERQGVSCC